MKYLQFYIILLGWWLGLQMDVKGQNPFRFQLDEQKALPSNIIYSVAKDQKGYMWMTSNAGLFRYDGFQYKIFRTDKQTSLPGGNVQFDQYGRTWYENFDGFVYYVKDEKLHALEQQSSPIGFIPFGMTEKYLYVVQQKGVDIYDLRSLEIIKTIPIPLEEPEHACVMGDNFYLISEGLIFRIDAHFNVTSTDYFKGKNWRVKYINAYENLIYIVSKNNEDKKLYFFTPTLEFLHTIPIKEVPYIHGTRALDSKILIYSSHGVFIYDNKGVLQFNQRAIFPDQNISSIEKDYQNNYWVSTVFNGVWVIPELNNIVYPLVNFKPSRLVKEKNGYLVGTHFGEILRLNAQKSLVETVITSAENLPVTYIDYDTVEHQSYFASSGFSIISNSDFSKKRTHYNVAVKQFKRMDEKYYAFAGSGVCGLYISPKANSKIKSNWDSFFEQHRSKNSLVQARIFKGVRGKSVDYHPEKESLVFATSVGVFLQTPTQQHELHQNKESIYANDVVWVGDELYILDTKGKLLRMTSDSVVKCVNDEIGIVHEEFKRVKKYNDALLMIGTHSVSLYDTKTRRLVHSSSNIGNTVVMDAIKDGHSLLLLTKEGLLEYPIESNLDGIAARFYINSVEVNGVKQSWEKQLKFGYNENRITIDFSILDYLATSPPLQYRINKGDWHHVELNSRKIDFPSLAPGQYLIEFKINNEISDEVIRIAIDTPFWQAWWFYLLCTIIVGSLVTIYYRQKSKVMQEQIALLNEKVILEKNLSKSVLTSIKSQMNPHFFYNALNTIQAYIFTNDRQKANNYLAKFSKLTRIILEMSEQETISLREEIEAIALYLELEKMRFTTSFEYSIIVDDCLDKDSIELPPMLIQPYVENAIKHGLLHRQDAKKLDLSFAKENDKLVILVEDNGIGRKRSAELNKIKESKHQSFATKANEKRLEILNKKQENQLVVNVIDKYDQVGNAMGTRVEITIPLN